jgi:hypothetical protein
MSQLTNSACPFQPRRCDHAWVTLSETGIYAKLPIYRKEAFGFNLRGLGDRMITSFMYKQRMVCWNYAKADKARW